MCSPDLNILSAMWTRSVAGRPAMASWATFLHISSVMPLVRSWRRRKLVFFRVCILNLSVAVSASCEDVRPGIGSTLTDVVSSPLVRM